MGRSRKKKENLSKSTPVDSQTFDNAALDFLSFARESKAPIVSERIQKTKNWVFWGEDNLYPNDLIRMADNSALHSAILDTKAKMIAGDGLVFDGAGSAEAEEFLEEATSKWGGVNKTIERLSTDVAYFSALALNVNFNRGGEIDTIKHSDHSYLRSGKMDIDTRTVNEYWHSTRWDIATNKRVYSKDEEIYRPVQILAFDPKRMKDKLSTASGQIIINKRYSPSVIYYAKPSYIGATNYIEIASKIANFHKNQLDNGMTGNMHIHLMQDLSNPEKRIKLTQEINDQYTGTNNAGRVVLTWGVNAQNVPIVTQLQSNDAHEKLTALGDKVNESIVSGHSIPRQLTQLDAKTGLGGLEMSEAIDMYQTLTITPDQQLIEDTLNNILKFNKISATVKIEELKPSTLILSDTLMKLSTTVNELRKTRSEEPLEDERGDKLLTELESKKDDSGSDTTGKERPGQD